MKLTRAQELMGQLTTKSAILNKKVGEVEECASNLKCGFETLEGDVTVLETARDMVIATGGLEQHDNEAASQLSDLLCAVEEKKARVRVLKEFLHPCGHGNWKRVEYLDFRDTGTACPSVFASDVYSERSYTCSLLNPAVTECNTHTINVHDREYTKVCGRVRAYGVGLLDAFAAHDVLGIGINGAYVTGVSLTHGGDLSGTVNLATHIWSFVVGLDQTAEASLGGAHCPCDGGISPPDFVGENYFCEAPIEEIGSTTLGTFHPNNVLWDGENCGTQSECCTRLSHPYFVKQLETPTTDDIDLRVCSGDGDEDVALELVEIYIQ